MTLTALGDGRIVIGARVEIGGWSTLTASPGGVLIIGDDVFIGGWCIVAAAERVEIGAEAMLAEMVSVRDHDHDPDAPPRSGALLVDPVRIGARAWIGGKASVLRGGQVGDDTVVGAHALVNSALPSNVLAAGLPARVLRQRRAGA